MQRDDPALWKELEDQILDCHARNDAAGLIDAYCKASDGLFDLAQDEEAWFFVTQAYVFALEASDPRANSLQDRLKRAGREM
ncbi:MAG: hypothetical protein AAF468_14880 [Pseudomonadota bacterium]